MASRERRLIALLSSAGLALLVACIVIAVRQRSVVLPADLDLQAALERPEVRDAVVRRLARTTVDVFDSHNDPDVGRVLIANLENAERNGVDIRTSALGLRERDFALPKPKGTLRIVLLGDSYVMGYGVEAEERVGVFLERALREHAPSWKGPIECLHIGIGGWDVAAECAYVRRLLSELRPDLVLQLVVPNDLDDLAGVRGFGALAAYTPREPWHTDALVRVVFPVQFTQKANANYLLEGFDFESRQRYEKLAAELERFAQVLGTAGSRYLIVASWGHPSAKLWRVLGTRFTPEQCLFLPASLRTDPDLILSATDQHWSPRGHEYVAKLFYTAIRERGLLPALALEPWSEAEPFARAELARGREEASVRPDDYWQGPSQVRASLEPARFTSEDWRQVYTGLDEQALVSPFASFLLLARQARHVRIRGRALDRPELAGARVRVSVEEFAAGELELVPGQPFDQLLELPAGVLGRDFATVRLETNDYVYAGPNRQHCVSFQLAELALEP